MKLLMKVGLWWKLSLMKVVFDESGFLMKVVFWWKWFFDEIGFNESDFWWMWILMKNFFWWKWFCWTCTLAYRVDIQSSSCHYKVSSKLFSCTLRWCQCSGLLSRFLEELIDHVEGIESFYLTFHIICGRVILVFQCRFISFQGQE